MQRSLSLHDGPNMGEKLAPLVGKDVAVLRVLVRRSQGESAQTKQGPCDPLKDMGCVMVTRRARDRGSITATTERPALPARSEYQIRTRLARERLQRPALRRRECFRSCQS